MNVIPAQAIFKKLAVVQALAMATLAGTQAHAITWDGSTNNLWLTADNWTLATVPNAVGAQVTLDRAAMATPGNLNLDIGGNTVTVGRIDVVTTTNFEVTFSNGKIVFDNGGSNAIWNVENDGGSKSPVTVKLGNVEFNLSDNLVVTSRSSQQFRPGGTLTDAAGESHSVTYTSDLGFGNKGFKLAWTATNTGGTIVDAGQIRFNSLNGDNFIGQAASGADIVLKNGGLIWNEESNHTLSRSIEIGTGGGSLVSEGNKFLTLSGEISGSGDLKISTKDTGVATVNLTGATANSLTGNVLLDNPNSVNTLTLMVVADKVGAFGQTPMLTIDDQVTLQITANAIGGQGAIHDSLTLVKLMGLNSFIDVATGVDELIGAGMLQVFDGASLVTIANGTYLGG